MEDTRYDDYFATALKADTPASTGDRIEAVRSLTAHIESNLAAQDIPADVRASELALARAAADKLITQFEGDFVPVVAAVGTQARGWRARLTPRALGIAFVASALTAFAAVKWLLRYIQSHRFTAFAVYRLALGIVLLLWLPAGS